MRKPKVPLTFRSTQKKELEEFAKREERTVSQIVGMAIREFLIRRELSIRP